MCSLTISSYFFLSLLVAIVNGETVHYEGQLRYVKDAHTTKSDGSILLKFERPSSEDISERVPEGNVVPLSPDEDRPKQQIAHIEADTAKMSITETSSGRVHSPRTRRLNVAPPHSRSPEASDDKLSITGQELQTSMLDPGRQWLNRRTEDREGRTKSDSELSPRSDDALEGESDIYDENVENLPTIASRSLGRATQQNVDIAESARKFGFQSGQAHNILQGVGERLKADQAAAKKKLETARSRALKDGEVWLDALTDVYMPHAFGHSVPTRERFNANQVHPKAWKALNHNLKQMSDAQRVMMDKKQDIESIGKVGSTMQKRMRATFRPLVVPATLEDMAAKALAELAAGVGIPAYRQIGGQPKIVVNNQVPASNEQTVKGEAKGRRGRGRPKAVSGTGQKQNQGSLQKAGVVRLRSRRGRSKKAANGETRPSSE